MRNQDQFLDKVSSKTNVKKEDILSLASSLQNKDFKDEANLRELIGSVSKLAGKHVTHEQEDKIISMVLNSDLSSKVDKMVP